MSYDHEADLPRILQDLRTHLLAGDFNHIPAETLGQQYTVLRQASLVVHIALTDWGLHEGAPATVPGDSFDAACHQARTREIVEIWRRLKPSWE